MSTRSNIRPRPVDINKQLLTVKDVAELDSIDLSAADLGLQVRGNQTTHKLLLWLVVLTAST